MTATRTFEVKLAIFLRRLLFLGLALIVALAPLPLGSNRDWSWSPLAVIVGTLLIAQASIALRPNIMAFASFRALIVPAGLATVVVVWALAQAVGWTPVTWENPIRIASAPYLPPSVDHPVALATEQVMTGLMRLLTYVGVFVIAADLSSDPRAARRLYAIVVWSAVGYTLYSMVAGVANRMTIATGIILPVPLEDFFSGPFINRNNYGTYAAIAALAALTLSIHTMRVRVSNVDEEPVAERWRRRIGVLSGRGGLWLAAAAILLVGVLLSGSRAAWASMMIGIFTMALQRRSSSRWSVGAAAVLGLAALLLFVPAGTAVLTRAIILVEHGELGREQLFYLTTNAISLRPLLGWGMNSFQSLYGVFQPTVLSDVFDKAHNTYLELAMDLGVPVAAALVLAVVWIAVRCLRGLSERHQDRELAGLGFCVAITVGIHALFDFSLQIPGVVVVFAALLGAAWAQSWSSRRLAI
jgi:hypothetical protein